MKPYKASSILKTPTIEPLFEAKQVSVPTITPIPKLFWFKLFKDAIAVTLAAMFTTTLVLPDVRTIFSAT